MPRQAQAFPYHVSVRALYPAGKAAHTGYAWRTEEQGQVSDGAGIIFLDYRRVYVLKLPDVAFGIRQGVRVVVFDRTENTWWVSTSVQCSALYVRLVVDPGSPDEITRAAVGPAFTKGFSVGFDA